MGYVLPLQTQHITYYIIIIIMDMHRLQDKTTTYTTCMTQEHLHLAWERV